MPRDYFAEEIEGKKKDYFAEEVETFQFGGGERPRPGVGGPIPQMTPLEKIGLRGEALAKGFTSEALAGIPEAVRPGFVPTGAPGFEATGRVGRANPFCSVHRGAIQVVRQLPDERAGKLRPREAGYRREYRRDT